MTKPAQALVARYADVNHFLECYNPDRQTKIAPTLDAALDADTPQLKLVACAYGRKHVRIWLMIQLRNLSEYAGARDKMTTEQMTQVADLIMHTHPELTLAQVMHFMLKLKNCDYGKFYGAVDPITVMGAFKTYCAELWDEKRRRAQETLRLKARQQTAQLEQEKATYRRRIPGASLRDTDGIDLYRPSTGPDRASGPSTAAPAAVQRPTVPSAGARGQAQPATTTAPRAQARRPATAPPAAPLISYPAYCALHLDDYGDGVVAQLVSDLQQGRKHLPPVPDIWKMDQTQRTEFVLSEPA